MDFENELTSKILDPIHGTIRLTTLEIAFINHPLFQRLRNIKQNSFLIRCVLLRCTAASNTLSGCCIYQVKYSIIYA
ncbi:Uncharacterised protein [Klebsiella pneumoniae]|nr:Uncharacterised protein [Klebsiella pneumoniae]CAA0274783.1 Uncharacterised protein [Klebsiella pneumoniae]